MLNLRHTFFTSESR